jgi:hypothetical protein
VKRPFLVVATVSGPKNTTLTIPSTLVVSDAKLTGPPKQNRTMTLVVSSPAEQGHVTGTEADPLAFFVDLDAHADVSDYTATVDLGDNSLPQELPDGNIVHVDELPSPEPGQPPFRVPGISFEVLGSHTYAQPGHYTISVTIQDVGGSTTTQSLQVYIVRLEAEKQPQVYEHGYQVPGAPPPVLARIFDPFPDAKAADYTARVMFDNGVTINAKVVAAGSIQGEFDILGVAKDGKPASLRKGNLQFTAYVTGIDREHKDQQFLVSGHALVLDAPLTVLRAEAVKSPLIFEFRDDKGNLLGRINGGTVLVRGSIEFHDEDPEAMPKDFAVTIHRSNGSTVINFPVTKVSGTSTLPTLGSKFVINLLEFFTKLSNGQKIAPTVDSVTIFDKTVGHGVKDEMLEVTIKSSMGPPIIFEEGDARG